MPNKKVLVISLVTIILILVAVIAQLSYTILNSKEIYKGVSVRGVQVGNMSREEAKSALEESFQKKASATELTLQSQNATEKINFSDVGVQYGISEAVDKAYAVGREGNIFKRLSAIYRTGSHRTDIPLAISYSEEKVRSQVDSLYQRTLVEVKQAEVQEKDGRLTVVSGHSGKSIDREKVLGEIRTRLEKCEGGALDIPVTLIPPNKIDVDALYKQIVREPADAYVKVVNNKTEIVPEVSGVKLDKTTLASLVQDLEKKEDNEVAIPAELVPAKLTTKDISAKLFKNVLHSWSTLFFTNTPINLNRAQNIRLAVGKVNGKILAPGDVFSFNETVGPRTEAAGFKDAYIFVKGEMVEGTGGGICQVTSTLYNAVLFSDLEVVERRNHMFAVTYTPPGRDATVAYGSVDFRFRNNTEWPLRIDARVTKDNKIIFALVGTDENPGKTVEVYQKIIKETDFTIKYKDDPTLPEGTTVVTHNGMKGYVVDTYKLVKENGKVISDKKIHRSVYTPQPQEVSRGTMKVKDPAVDVPATTVPGDSAPVDVNPPATDVNPPADSSQGDTAPLE